MVKVKKINPELIEAACDAYSEAAFYSISVDPTMRLRMTAALEAVIDKYRSQNLEVVQIAESAKYHLLHKDLIEVKVRLDKIISYLDPEDSEGE